MRILSRAAPIYPRREVQLSARQLAVIAEASASAKSITDQETWRAWKAIFDRSRPTIAELQASIKASEWRCRR